MRPIRQRIWAEIRPIGQNFGPLVCPSNLGAAAGGINHWLAMDPLVERPSRARIGPRPDTLAGHEAAEPAALDGFSARTQAGFEGQPAALTLASVMRLQRAAGNMAVSRLLQRERRAAHSPSRPAVSSGANSGSAPLLANLGPMAGMPTIQMISESSNPRFFVQRLCVRDDAGPGAEAGGEAAAPGLSDIFGGLGDIFGGGGGGGGGGGSYPGLGEPGIGGPGGGTGAESKPTLRWGSRGPSVIELQGRLNDRGADPALDPDGIFGTKTKNAVVAYQSANELVPDGIVGQKTWGKLLEEKKEEPPEPVDPLADLPVEVVGHGASDGAVAAARQSAIELFGDLTDPSKAQLKTSKVALDVIPHDKQLTDLDEYKHLKGTPTPDGRIWDTVRGIRTTINGVIRFAIAEEDLVSVPGKPAGYGDGFLAAHEGGHALEASSFTPGQAATLQALFTARIAASGPITPTTAKSSKTEMWLHPSWYSAFNKAEYFGNSAAAYLGHPYTNGDEDKLMYNRSWLQTNDAGMYGLLQSVFAH